jgi:two-component system, NarL family, vancomycin resistance associated response regulator VraR
MVTKESKVNLNLFTRREIEILNLVTDGYRDNEIAEKLHIRVGSVGRHESNVIKKVGGSDLSSAVKYALEKGLISITYA